MAKSKPKLRIVPLGGCGEVGKNMTVIELGNDAIIVDTGVMFPANDMLGIDYIIPDFRYLHGTQRPDQFTAFSTHMGTKIIPARSRTWSMRCVKCRSTRPR